MDYYPVPVVLIVASAFLPNVSIYRLMKVRDILTPAISLVVRNPPRRNDLIGRLNVPCLPTQLSALLRTLVVRVTPEIVVLSCLRGSCLTTRTKL